MKVCCDQSLETVPISEKYNLKTSIQYLLKILGKLDPTSLSFYFILLPVDSSRIILLFKFEKFLRIFLNEEPDDPVTSSLLLSIARGTFVLECIW